MKYVIICLGAFATYLGLGVTAHAQSQEISYSFIEAVYQAAEASASGLGDLDADGPRFAASLSLADHFHVFGNYEKLKLDDVIIDDGSGTPVNISFSDIDTWGVGVGLHTSVFGGRSDGQIRNPADRYSVFLDAQYLSADPGDSDGFAVDAGFRAINFTSWEFIAAAGYENLSGIDGEFTLEGRLLYRLVNDLQIQAGIDWNDNVTRYFIGLRYNFPGLKLF
ncbi:MAG: hypothetical protein OER85_16755 [Gammaproteobacteria bacterium]|nr:hypothetical protein [Gammaproteobacteria bacterium]